MTLPIANKFKQHKKKIAISQTCSSVMNDSCYNLRVQSTQNFHHSYILSMTRSHVSLLLPVQQITTKTQK